MVDLKTTVPGIVLDLRYATKNNFTGKRLYKKAKTTFMRTEAANALQEVQQLLAKEGYGIKVFDAYRPWSATRKMWELVQDERYVANPAKGSNHNRGLAIDLTLIRLSTGEELNMGTGFDNFTDTAHHTFTNLSQQIIKNRMLLKGMMEKKGFASFESEWWHYTWSNNRNYEVLDIDFKKLN
jgi:zinc D-Ala-D-Ala dipeptidase